MQRTAFERSDGTYYAERQHDRVVAIYGPAPPTGPSPLVLTLQEARPRDRRAVADGVSRRVSTGHAPLDEVCWVDTRLDDAHVSSLFVGLEVDALVHAFTGKKGTLRVRSAWTHLEFHGGSSVGRRRIAALVDAVAHVARAARTLPADAPILVEAEHERPFAVAASAVILGVFGLWWLLPWARLDQASLGVLSSLASEGAVSALVLGTAVGGTVYALVRSVARRRKAGRTDTHRLASIRALAAALWIGLLVTVALVLSNRMLDRSVPEIHVGRIVKHSYSPKNDLVMGLCIEYPQGRSCAFRNMNDGFFTREDLDNEATLSLRAGALGWPWVESMRLAPENGR